MRHVFNPGEALLASDLNDNSQTSAIQCDSNTATTISTPTTGFLLTINGIEQLSGAFTTSSLSGNAVTLPTSGIYIVSCEVIWSAGASTQRSIWLSLNGATAAAAGTTETVLNPTVTYRQHFMLAQFFNANATLGICGSSTTTGVTARVERFVVALVNSGL